MLHPNPTQYCHIAEEDLPLSECLKDCVAQHAGSAVLAVATARQVGPLAPLALQGGLSCLLAAPRSRNEQLGTLRARWDAAVRP